MYFSVYFHTPAKYHMNMTMTYAIYQNVKLQFNISRVIKNMKKRKQRHIDDKSFARS